MNRRDTIYSHFPPAPAYNYELDPERGYLSVIMPEATTNLVTNPSLEAAAVTTGYSNYNGATGSGTTAWQAYGANGLSIATASGAESGCFYGNVPLVAGTTYTASLTIQGEEGRKYFIWFATTAGALIGSKRTWIGTGRKQRIWVTYTETSSTDRRVYFTRDAYNDTHVFYADGLQVEAKAYPTTYCDGDQKGFVINQAAYLWTGTPHASTSTRSAQTRAGGREVSLLSLGFRILSIIGLGMAPLVDQSLAIPGQGELYQGTGTTAREFQLVGSIFGDGPGPRHLQSIRDELIDAFKPDLTSVQQPLLLRYQALDENGDPCSDTLDLVCTYQGALEGSWTNHQREDIALQFKMHLPLIGNQYTNGAQLGFATTIANANYVIRRDPLGAYSALTTGMNGSVYCFAVGSDGSIYVGGDFTLAGGVANTVRIAKWDGTAWTPLATGASAIVFALAVGPDGSLYAGGQFTNLGSAAGDNIAKWDGATWSALATGMNAEVRALVFGPDGTLYAGGTFSSASGVANTTQIAKWNGAAWSALSTGMGGGAVGVYSLAVGIDGSIYAGGNFTTSGGVSTKGIAKWNGAAWSALATGTGGVGTVEALVIGSDGSLYAGGSFPTMSGVANTAFVAKWNGSSWSPLDRGFNNEVTAMAKAPDGAIYAAGIFSTAAGITFPDGIALWNGSTWTAIDADLPGAFNVTALLVTPQYIYFGYTTNGSAVTSTTTTITNYGSSLTYPKFTFTGPGVINQIKNYTTGKTIYFNLTLLAGEKAVLDLDPKNITFVSNFRGNILSKILSGSSLNLSILPGDNIIAVFIPSGNTAATAVIETWKQQYWSLDGAVVK